MGSLKKLSGDEEQPSDGPSFGERFRAWWDGYELEPPKAKRVEAPEDDVAPAEQDRFAPLDRSSPWPDSRQAIAQLVWGEGFVGPGDPGSAIDTVQAFGLDSSASMLEIGAGTGGGTRAVASQFGANVSGFDLEPELAAEATIQAEVHGLDLKAAVHPLDPDNTEFKPRVHAGAVIRETLYRIADKRAFLAKVVDSLKPGGHLVIIDLFFADDTDTSEMDRWRDGERSEAYGCEIDEAREILAKLSVDVRTCTDESASYSADNVDSWKNFVRYAEEDPLPDDLVLTMVDEAEFWSRRMTAIQSGDLKVYRLNGLVSHAEE